MTTTLFAQRGKRRCGPPRNTDTGTRGPLCTGGRPVFCAPPPPRALICFGASGVKVSPNRSKGEQWLLACGGGGGGVCYYGMVMVWWGERERERARESERARALIIRSHSPVS